MMTVAACTMSIMLAGCSGDSLSPSAKANRPIPDKLLAQISEKNMEKDSPILVRIFKEESELEVWKQDRTGRFALLKTYPICRWSGELGPKVREGDRQAPEGFYAITPGQMNPQSAYYLSFNIGYPNAFDKALGRTGSQLMVHGDCSSRGCYAMTDEQIAEIFALGRESFFGGQASFQVQAYPFRMTPQNLARHRDNPNMAFWRTLKRGYDHFEVARLEPKVEVCNKHYVFDPEPEEGAKKPLTFKATAACPAYRVNTSIASAVREKEQHDEQQFAALVAAGTKTVPIRTGTDGGMHPVFAAKLGVETPESQQGVDYTVASYIPAPGTIPPTVNPPKAPEAKPEVAAAPASRPETTRSSQGSRTSGGSLWSRVASAVGFGPSEKSATTPQSSRPPAAMPKRRPRKANVTHAKQPAKPALRPATTDMSAATSKNGKDKPEAHAERATAFGSPTPAQDSQALAGAQPIRSSNSFENRWSAFR